MSGKYYAVLVGRKPGIYKTWKEAEAQIKGFPKAVFKSFKTENEAKEYMKIDMQDQQIVYPLSDSYVAFVDGSYTQGGDSGYGIVIIDMNGRIYDFFGKCTNVEKNSNNVAELTALLGVLKLVDANLVIYTDSKYAINSAKLPSSTEKTVSNNELIQEVKRLYNLRSSMWRVSLNHVYGHKGQEMNERADRLARLGAV